ncbi:competence/damage-inducible protein A [Thermophagus xiamenensis]|uniref:CinA-like protein n=1 Tax=Thermophagus xiamenensis TaxID=385682 RepID=A0A1I2EBH8_9BACT|nr:competence/damage-inducible protein A [Thermophagus xiamenensis]SFE90364.1 nicotinamide-nucleotide amidase [Thermophagus xiamenensis]
MIEIITIGDELLIGQVIDTNSAWMGKELNLAGFEVVRVTSVRDRKDEIKEALAGATRRSSVVLITGGLGPTRDDITKQTLCEFFNTRLVFNEEVYNDVKTFLKGRVCRINNLNRGQAMVPENCEVIRNPVGTAPIMWFEKEQKIVVSMPGVPAEMKEAMSKHIIPRLKARFNPGVIIHKTVLVYGITEAHLAEKLSGWEENLPKEIKLAYLPAPGRIRLRLTARGHEEEILKNNIDKAVKALDNIIGEHIYGYEDLEAAEIFGQFFRSTGKTLTVAESCSGGYLAHLITSIPGASNYFKGSVVAYSNELKAALLGVEPDKIAKYGAVSQPVVEEMALGALKVTGAHYAIATSGIAGPDGGTPQKPVGTIWIAWVGPNQQVVSKCFQFGNNRERNIIRTSETALIELMQMIKEKRL